jgi:spore germination protein GerM
MNTKRGISTTAVAVVVILVVVGIAGMWYYSQVDRNVNGNGNETPQTLSVQVHFIDTRNPASQTDCGVTRAVNRTIPYTLATADASLRQLFSGPTEAERAEGLISTFEPSANSQPATAPLGDYYLGVTIEDGVAVVNFSETALGYLNSPACMQASVKAPISDTLRQFPSVSSVEYAINGEIFTEWDA